MREAGIGGARGVWGRGWGGGGAGGLVGLWGGKGVWGEADVWKGLAAGVVGGLVASWVMNGFQEMWSRETEGIEKPHGAQSLKPSGGHEGVGEIRRAPQVRR